MTTEKKICTLTVGEEQIPYEFERKRIKRLNLRVRQDGTVHLSAPMTASNALIERFLREHGAWILEARGRMLSHAPQQSELGEGDTLLIGGVPHVVHIGEGARSACTCRDGVLLLTLPDTADASAKKRALRRFVKREAKTYLTARTRELWGVFSPRPATFPTLSFRWMKSRWGSCTAARNHITLNEKLLFVPPHLADYVILHELCHFVYQDHSPAFYRHLSAFYPAYREARRALARVEIPELADT